MTDEKILYLGLGKAWTSSFGTACEILGYRLCENIQELMVDINNDDYTNVWKLSKEYDVFEDYPWPFIWKEFEEKYPNTKFILGYRPTDEWIKSLVFQALRVQTVEKRRETDMRHTEIFKNRVDSYDKYLPLHMDNLIKMYDKHNTDIRNYFKGKDNYMEFNVKDGWAPLCEFLGKDVPELPFPHRKNAYPYPQYERLLRISKGNPERFFGW